MRMTKTTLAGLALGAVIAVTATTGRATIIGSSHDFSSTGGAGAYSKVQAAKFLWGGGTKTNADGSVNASAYYENPCQVCHIPHKAPSYSAVNAPLWNHNAASNATTRYTTYDQGGSATFNALGLGAITSLGSSAACLSCHDGSIGINQAYGKTTFNGDGTVTTNVYAPSFAIETVGGSTDLTHMHPLGVNYDQAASADPQLKPVVSGTIIAQMIKGPPGVRTMECASCHDIHETIGTSGTIAYDHALMQPLQGGQLCLTCHDK
jgi:hypothetical protein